jgi:hypothetical protein
LESVSLSVDNTSTPVIELEDRKMRYGLIVLWMLFWSATSAMAQVSVGIGLPGVSIGINLPLFPQLVRVPGYPVYYAPQVSSNYFYYDGMYWVYQGDNWYASSWYNGPWGQVTPEVVPLFVLRIPVRYYRNPPTYFGGWRADAPPRWGEHWGNQWEQRRSGWDRWNRSSAPAPAPLPAYQRQYSGDRYPRAEQQPALHGQNYRYQPRDAVVRQHYQEQGVQRTPAPSQRGPKAGPAVQRSQPLQRGGEDVQRSAPTQAPAQQRGPAVQDQRQQPQRGAAQREQQTPRSSQETSPQGKGAPQEPRRGKAQEKDREKGEERGQERTR